MASSHFGSKGSSQQQSEGLCMPLAVDCIREIQDCAFCKACCRQIDMNCQICLAQKVASHQNNGSSLQKPNVKTLFILAFSKACCWHQDNSPCCHCQVMLPIINVDNNLLVISTGKWLKACHWQSNASCQAGLAKMLARQVAKEKSGMIS